jgi:predicted dehydrogenase
VSATIRVAMIGAGGFARRHLEVLERIGGTVVVGHHARRFEAASAQAERFGGEPFDDLEALFTRSRPDAVWISLPPGAHGPAEAAAVAAGVPLFVEKPLAADLATAEAIGADLERTGLLAAVGYHWRALDTLDEVRERLGRLEVRLVRGSWHGSTPPPAWWQRRATGGGQVVEQATHVLDLARHLLGEAEVLAASAPVVARASYPDSDVAPASAALLRFERGPIGSFTATCALAGSAEVELSLYAEGLHVSIDQTAVRYDDGRERREVRRRGDPVEREDRAFLDAVRTGDPARVLCDYRDALATQRLTTEVQRLADEAGGR